MQVIETIAPISLDHLKVYFTDKETLFKINYADSELKEDKLFVYLSNLELPCDLVFSSDEEVMAAVKSYLHFSHILSVPILENLTISLLLQFKGIGEDKIWPEEFLNENSVILNSWVQKLESLTIYNLYTVDSEDLKDYVKTFKEDNTSSTEGINFVSLLKNPNFYMFYNSIDENNLTYYSTYFEEYMFKGSNLYSYWANENNPMFMLTWSIVSGELNYKEYFESIKNDEQELALSVSPSS
jgi:hypothetical protein